MNRRAFLILGGGAAACGRSAPTRAADPDYLSLSECLEALARGSWTSARLAEHYLARIEALDRTGPRLNSVIEINPNVVDQARRLDRERASGRLRGPLHGAPVLIKDNIETAGDGMRTSAGSLALSEWRAPGDAFVAARLRAAGALLLGKTNLSEWANFRSTHSISGWSGRAGQTRNPHALDRNPSGSSSGSAVAVAAGLCAAALGTETDGSVTSPSSINGICGLKPTVGLVSRSGIIPISASQDTAGPMARTVRDLAILLGAMAGADPADPATAASAGKTQTDYTRFLDPRGLRGARLGIARKFYEKNSVLDGILSGCADALKRAGAEAIDPADLDTHGRFDAPEMETLLCEFKDGINRYLAKLPAGAPARSLKELIAFNESHRQREMPLFGQELFLQAEAKGPLTDALYLAARRECLRLARTDGIDALLRKHKLDAVVTLTSGPAWLIDPVNGDHFPGDCTTPPAVAGYPHITAPAGFYRGLPIGISFFGPAWSEPSLLKLAYGWEQETRARRKPGFAPAAA